MADRYFVETPIAGDRATLNGPEAHHLLHVMRAQPGTEVAIFDGSGEEFLAVVDRSSRSEVQLRIAERRAIDRELPFALTLAVALPKGDRQKWLVEKTTELGVTRIVPLKTQRGVAQPVEQALTRLRRGVIEASKQCGRNRLMQIDEPVGGQTLTEQAADQLRLLAHPKSALPNGCVCEATGTVSPLREAASTRGIVVAIGPEGGFTDDEVVAACNLGWQPIDLGRRILRVETAAIALAAMLATGAD